MILCILIPALLFLAPLACSGETFRQYPFPWDAHEQVETRRGGVLSIEREIFERGDRSGCFAIGYLSEGPRETNDLEAHWQVRFGAKTIASGKETMEQGMVVVDFSLQGLAEGGYEVKASLVRGAETIWEEKKNFILRADGEPPSAQKGRIPLVLPAGVPPTSEGYPLTFGVPFPKGGLADLSKIRLVDARGEPVAAQFTVRGYWGSGVNADIRWLGVDFQSPEAGAWWPQRQETPYFLEYGEAHPSVLPAGRLQIRQEKEGVYVDTGRLRFKVPSRRFNLFDEVFLDGRKVLAQGGEGGAYLIDHEGATYRAANDVEPLLTVEEEGPLRVVIRVEGWYVKDGTSGETQSFRLPTDRLCKFVTRVEAYAGLSWVRVLHQWINTSDSFKVRFQDVGVSLVHAGIHEVEFGVEGAPPIKCLVEEGGVCLLQHRHHQFEVHTHGERPVIEGEKSDGSVMAIDQMGQTVTISHRETWQRFPKELEVLPDRLTLHVWPVHGRDHPEIDSYARDRYHQHWFSHQGRVLNLTFPWQSLLTVFRFADSPSIDIYKPGGTAMGGIHASAMGTAITSDFMVHFGEKTEAEATRKAVAAFQARPTALAEPSWTAASGALGPIHPYDPESFSLYEQAAQDAIFGMWKLQDYTEEYGMYLYRGWHHGIYEGEGHWSPYRLYSAGHHYEPYLPWLYFARSGDPGYAGIGQPTIRHVTDLGIIRYNDPAYEHREYFSQQGRLPGSTRHSNGFVLWGGDHAALGHPTCYGGIMLAYYLTGDLSLKEVVNQWKHTLLEDRGNPEIPKAIRNRPGRDNNNGLGELIDLYQLTYDPRLLLLMEPWVERMKENLYTWGRGVPNTLFFRRTPEIRNRLVEAARERQHGRDISLHGAFNFHSPEAVFSLAGGLDTTGGFDAAALAECDIARYLRDAATFSDPMTKSRPAHSIADRYLYLPYLLKSGTRLAGEGGALQVLPLGTWSKEGRPSRVIVEEEEDGDLVLTLKGRLRSQEARVEVVRPDGILAHHENLAPEPNLNRSIRIPKDGQTGAYIIDLWLRGDSDLLLLPLTNLPKEVYPVTRWSQAVPSTYYVGAPNASGGRLEFAGGSGALSLHAETDGRLLGKHPLHGEAPLSVPFPSGGVRLTAGGRWVFSGDARPLILSCSPAAFFMPDEQVLTFRPKGATP